MKRNQKISVIVASILLSNSLASAAIIERSADAFTTASELASILNSTDKTTLSELETAYKQIEIMANSLSNIQNNNNQDQVLKFANTIQVLLVGATSLSLKSHLGQADTVTKMNAKNYSLQLAAASSLLNLFIRYYTQFKNIEPEKIGITLDSFSNELLKEKALTPELSEVIINIKAISKDLILSKSQIESVVQNIGGTSDYASAAIILMALAQWISPKLTNESQSLFKKYGSLLINKGNTVAANGTVIKSTGTLSGLPDLIGVALGLKGENSQKMISTTLINLETTLIQLKAQIISVKEQIETVK